MYVNYRDLHQKIFNLQIRAGINYSPYVLHINYIPPDPGMDKTRILGDKTR